MYCNLDVNFLIRAFWHKQQGSTTGGAVCCKRNRSVCSVRAANVRDEPILPPTDRKENFLIEKRHNEYNISQIKTLNISCTSDAFQFVVHSRT